MAVVLAIVLDNGLWAQIPNGYYNNATGKTGDELKSALHDIIGGHTTISYQQIWSAFWSTDNKGNNVVWDMYSDGAPYTYNYSNGNNQCGEYEQEGDCYNREHSWPKSWFSGDEQTVPGRDLHHIFPTDGYVNAERGNYPYGEVNNSPTTVTFQNGSKLGPCKSSLGYNGKVFEPIDEYKGDFARAIMYMSVRYYGEDSDWGSSGMTNKSVIKPWAIAMLLNWSDNDPVSQKEIDRNNVVYGIQGNRNPFIDHPEYAHIIWEPGWTGVTYNITCASVQHGSISAPATAVEGTMVSLTATPSQGYMLGSWNVYKTGDANTTVPVSSNGSFTMPSFNVTVSANFVQNTTYYTITKGSVSHGSISVSASAQSGTMITLSNTPANGYVLYSYYVYKTGDINTIVYSGSGNTFIMPAYDVTVSASFVQPSSYSYVKVTEAPTDWSGEYILVYENSATEGYVWTGVNTANCFVSETISDNTIADDGFVTLTIASMTGGYSIRIKGGTNNNKYIYGTSGSNGISFGNNPSLNTISYEYESNSSKIVSNTSVLRYNSSATVFRYYKSSTYTEQQPVQLYKKTANGSAPTHTIQFKPNGSSQSSYTQTVTEFEPAALQANTFTREGYAFDSWNTAADGTGTTYFNGAIVNLLDDLTLFAQWRQLFTITMANVENGTITVSHNQAVEGDIVSLTATPATGYEFDHWMVTDATNNLIPVADNEFEMPASHVTVSAVFAYIGTFSQQYYLVTDVNQLVAGRTYLIVNTSARKAMGASSSNGNNRTAVDVTITDNVIPGLGNACELTLGSEGNYWTLFDANWGTSGGFLYAASSGSNYLKTQATCDDNGRWSISITSNGVATIQAQGTNTRNVIKYNSGNNPPIFSCYASSSNMQNVYLFIRSEEYDHTESETIAQLYSFDKHTVRNGATLTVSGTATCNDASHLILEEGAQLVHHSDNVKATVKKYVEAYTTDGGWYTIATPFSTYNPANTPMMGDSYDLYAYDESAEAEWRNYKAGAFSLASGHGYLYAHNPAATLRMAGTLNNGNTEQAVTLSYANSEVDLKGFNLLGNPTAHDITFTKTDYVSDGYYYLNNSENWVYETGNIVPVGRGFMVKANAAGQTVTLNPQGKGNGADKGQYLCVAVGEEKVYVKLNEGVSMPSLNLDGHRAGLYLTHAGQPYAMLVRDGAAALDLCFEARHTGDYTLSVDTQGLPLDYHHLIDHLTGADIDLLSNRETLIAGLPPLEGVPEGRGSKDPQYPFHATPADYPSRFRLVFTPSVPEPVEGPNQPFAYLSHGDIIVNGTGTLQVIDMTGRVIVCRDAINRVSTTGIAPGVYVLRLITPEKVRVQKIVIQ